MLGKEMLFASLGMRFTIVDWLPPDAPAVQIGPNVVAISHAAYDALRAAVAQTSFAVPDSALASLVAETVAPSKPQKAMMRVTRAIDIDEPVSGRKS